MRASLTAWNTGTPVWDEIRFEHVVHVPVAEHRDTKWLPHLSSLTGDSQTKLYRLKLYLKPIASKDNQFSLSSHLSTLPEQDIVAFRIVDYSPFRSPELSASE